MTRITVLGRLTAADADTRTLSGMLLPFGVPGSTNLGKVTASPGVVDIPDSLDALHASLDHLDDRDSVAKFSHVEETAAGLLATWTVPKTHGGDRLLAEHAAGIRTGVSVELEPVHIKDGQITAGTLVGCAFPERPAFDSARLFASLAEDTEEPQVDDDLEDDTDDTDDTNDPEAAPASDDDNRGENMPKPNPAGATAPITPARGPKRLTAENIETKAEFFRLMAEARTDPRLMAALADIVPTSIDPAREVPQWVGELWSGSGYQRRITPLINQDTLTSLTVKGWRWTDRPEVARYAGNKADVPSGPATTEPVEEPAQRFAGAHDIDRKYKDFNDTAFFASYYAAMTESYARQTDIYVAEELKAGATPVTLGSVPSGVAPAWAALIDAALAVVDIGAPSFALVEKSVYREMILTPQDKFLEFLSAGLGLSEGQVASFKIIPVSTDAVGTASAVGLDLGEIVVGTRSAATWHELGGGAPIRVEAVDMARGGIDAGVFGYGGVVVHDPRGLAIADLTADV